MSWCNLPYSRMKSLESATVCELKQTWSEILTSDNSSFATSLVAKWDQFISPGFLTQALEACIFDSFNPEALSSLPSSVGVIAWADRIKLECSEYFCSTSAPKFESVTQLILSSQIIALLGTKSHGEYTPEPSHLTRCWRNTHLSTSPSPSYPVEIINIFLMIYWISVCWKDPPNKWSFNGNKHQP